MGVYLITGGASGIGADLALALRGPGHSILFADIERVELPGIRSVICDLSDEGQVASLLCGVEAVEGRLDGLICHAGAGRDEDCASTGRLINAAASLLRQPRGKAVAIGTRHPGALPEFARTLERELGPEIRVNYFAPFSPAANLADLTAYLQG